MDLQNLKDKEVQKFVPLLMQIKNAVILEKKIKERSTDSVAIPSSPSPSSPKIRFSSPSSPKWSTLRREKCQKAQVCHQLPGSPQCSPHPCRPSAGHTESDLSLDSHSAPSSRVSSPQLSSSHAASQNGGDRMVPSSSSQNPFRLSPRNPFLSSPEVSLGSSLPVNPGCSSSLTSRRRDKLPPTAPPYHDIMGEESEKFSHAASSGVPASLPAPAGRDAILDPCENEACSAAATAPFAAPVVYNRHGLNPQWRPFSHNDLKEVTKVFKEYGKDSQYFKNIFSATCTAQPLVPHDIKHVISCLLSSTQFKLWLGLWKEQLTEHLPIITRDPNHANLTLDHLCGEGQWSKPQDQANQIPRAVLEIIWGVAEKVFFTMPSKTTTKISYTDIKQGPTEDFIEFVDRLTAAIEAQIEDQSLHEQLIRDFAKRNANDACKAIIKTLPFKPPPSLLLMTEACMRQVADLPDSQQKKRESSGRILAHPANLEETKDNKATDRSQWVCSRCGKRGHTAKYCRAPAPIHSFSKSAVTAKPRAPAPPAAGTSQGN